MILAKPFPEFVSFWIYRHNYVVYSFRDRIFSFQINPGGKMHDLFR